MPIAIRLLGPVEVLVDGRPADISGPKRRALVALLALRGGRVVAVDTLVEALWGDDLPADPANAVQHHVTRLRQALGSEALIAGPEGYALGGAEVDALQFEALLREARAALRSGDPRGAAEDTAAALALWRGRPLLGLPEADWTGAEQERLGELRLDVLEERFEALLALGEHATLVSELREALEGNPFRERLWRQLMLALYRAGRQAEALEAFRAARRVLSEELGLEPGPDLQRMQAAILAQDPAVAAPPAAPRQRGNLPAAVTSFVGRKKLLAEIERLVRERRLVTLAGPPGVGKSRLALEAARALEAELGGGAWYVDLRRAETPADVPRLAARVVEAGRPSATGDPLRRLTQRLRDTDALLVVRECGHYAEEVAALASALLSECPRLHILATSRRLLRVPGEHRIDVGPLALPSEGAVGDAEAVQLFFERAGGARPGFTPTPERLQLVAEICRLVDGLPAAIELLAARVHVLGLREILTSVERWLTFLPERRLTADTDSFVREFVGWSYDLLHADEKALLHRIAVFRGGADREALCALSARPGLDEPTVTALLETLVDKSIVTASFPDGVARYNLLTTVRNYALERLTENGELDETKLAHARYFAALADDAYVGLHGAEQAMWRARVSRDEDNLWAAVGYAAEAADAELAQRIGVAAGWYFTRENSRVSDARMFVERALAVGGGTVSPQRVELLAHLTYLATVELDLDAALTAGEEALRLVAEIEAPRERAYLDARLALAAATAGDRPQAEARLDDALRTLAALPDDWLTAGAHWTAAIVAARFGDVEAATASALEFGRRARSLDYDFYLVPAALFEAWAAGRNGDMDAEARGYREALELAPDPLQASFALAGLAENALASGDADEAQALAERAVSKARHAHSPWLAAHARVALANVLTRKGDAVHAGHLYESVAAWAEGPRMHERFEQLYPLAGSPGARALLALSELADDEERSARLRARARAVAEADHVVLEPLREPEAV